MRVMVSNDHPVTRALDAFPETGQKNIRIARSSRSPGPIGNQTGAPANFERQLVSAGDSDNS